ncbi:hypothetical protein RHSIM_Rhsim12G0010300 [Rhododendron simsii]|uniref:RNase H type-1 domain-containing protein n=1 Tax=Rhododendron simsii TaxID=118357 RepID=A0A834G5Z0_RHOSS|nr:hypothetical protein RHSIM_Rhsim12G0010300 [Rhododendron simsii]
MKGTRWQIHNGALVDFWADKVAKIRRVLSEAEVQAVISIPISKIGGEDSIIWTLHASGNYTVKRGYRKAWNDYIASKPDRPSSSTVPAGFFPNRIGSVLGWSVEVKEEIDGGKLEARFLLSKAIFLAWYIWKARNELVFQSACNSRYATVASDEFISAKRVFLLRDCRGHLIDGRRFKISATSAFLAEASVIREACLFAKALNVNSVSVENDNVQLISLSVLELVPPWEVMAIISDIRMLAAELKLSFCWSPHEVNEATHWIASSQAARLGFDWVLFPPPVLYSILCNDAR